MEKGSNCYNVAGRAIAADMMLKHGHFGPWDKSVSLPECCTKMR